MPVLGIVGVVIAALALIAIVITFIWGEKSTPGEGFYKEMDEAERQLGKT